MKDYNVTWFKLGRNGNKKRVKKSQSYLKGIEYIIEKAAFAQAGDYVINVETEFDSDEKTVNLIVQDIPFPPMGIQAGIETYRHFTAKNQFVFFNQSVSQK
jgi:hypothetical protein